MQHSIGGDGTFTYCDEYPHSILAAMDEAADLGFSTYAFMALNQGNLSVAIASCGLIQGFDPDDLDDEDYVCGAIQAFDTTAEKPNILLAQFARGLEPAGTRDPLPVRERRR